MKTINTVNAAVIAKAAAEAGIRADENYSVYLISYENSLIELEFETEWNRITCYADEETGEILGLMAEARDVEELLTEGRISASLRMRSGSSLGRTA